MRTAHVVCREAKHTDAETIVQFQIAMAKETEDVDLDPETCGRGVGAVFATPRLGRYFVAEIEGRVVGSLMITQEWSDWRAATVWWIQSVFVPSEFRGLGVYGRLYGHIQTLIANDSEVSGLRLYVDRRNIAAQSVYARLGMNGDHYQVFEWMKS